MESIADYESMREYVDAWLAGSAAVPPILKLLGIRLTGCGDGEGVAELPTSARHHNAMGTVHGGVLCALADVATGGAVVSVLEPHQSFVSIQLSVDFLRGVKEGLLTARARVVRRGSKIVFCACRIEDDAKRHIADVRSNCLLTDLTK